MKKLFLFLTLCIIQLYSQSIFTMEIDRDAMQPMNVAGREYQTQHSNTKSFIQDPTKQYRRIMKFKEEKEEREFTCLQKCFTTHSDHGCIPCCCIKTNLQTRHHNGYCGSCCETTVVCSYLYIPACVIYTVCSGALS